MTNKEIVSLLAMATANFPSYQERDLKPTMLLWRETLSDMPFDIAKASLIKVLSCEGTIFLKAKFVTKSGNI